MEVVQEGTTLKFKFPEKEGQSFEVRLSTRVFRKFTKTVVDWIKNILSKDPEFKSYYIDTLFAFLTTKDPRFVLSKEFVDRCTEEASKYVSSYVKIVTSEGVLTHQQLATLYNVSFTLKLVSPFLYTTIMLEEERNVLFKKITEPLKDSGVESFLFEFVRLKFLARANTSLWSWIANNRFQDINYHVLNTYNTVLTQILLQLVPGHNPIAYIKTVVEYSIYYLLTDVYVDEVKYTEGELKKLRYTHNYSLIQKHAVKSTIDRLVSSVKNVVGTVKIRDQYNKALNVRPITNYITLPFLSRFLDVSYLYLQNVKQPQYLNVYVSLFLEKYASNLVLLRQLTRSFTTVSVAKYKSSMLGEYLKPLYELDHPLKRIFEETKVFDNVMKSLLSYDYWDLFSHQQITVSQLKLVKEINLFFTSLLTNKWKVVFDYLRSSNFDLQGGMLTWKV